MSHKTFRCIIFIFLFYFIVNLTACANKGDKVDAGSQSPVNVENDDSRADANDDYETNDYQEGLPTVIDFYATWCGPCKQIAPLFDSLKQQYEGKINFIRVDVDKQTELASQYSIEAMPTFVFLDNSGKEVNRIVGAAPQALRQAVGSLLD